MALRWFRSSFLSVHARLFTTTITNSTIVVGMGVAGATTALTSAKATILTASKINDCNSYWAQGGIIYRDGDPPSTSSSSSLPTLNESLFTDIVKAGGGLHVDTNVPGASPGRTSAAIKLATYGEPTVTALLVKSNVVNFDKADSKGSADSSSSLAYCLEGGHSAPRIIHVGDETGRYITEGLSRECVSAPHVEIKEHTVVTDLVWGKQKQVVGVDILNTLTNERGRMLTSSGVVLASGGYGNIYAESTNPSRGTFNALGNSLALAIRSDVGVKTAGLEVSEQTLRNTSMRASERSEQHAKRASRNWCRCCWLASLTA